MEGLSPLSHGACKKTCKPRAFATASHPEPRQSARNRALALCLRLSLLLLPRTRFTTALASNESARQLAARWALRCGYRNRRTTSTDYSASRYEAAPG